jgi:hypothetical protein
VAPNLRINNPLFGVLKLNEVLSISRDWITNITMASEFLSNPNLSPNPIMIENLQEFQETRGLNSWNSLTLDAKTSYWKLMLKNDLIKFRDSTNSLVNRH